jgi:hypothetical protein
MRRIYPAVRQEGGTEGETTLIGGYMRKTLFTAATAAAFSLAGVGTAMAATTLDWKFDSAPSNARVGSHVVIANGVATFDTHKPAEEIDYDLEHLIVTPDRDAVDPGLGPFTINLRFRTPNSFGNLLQKGQATAPGGQAKIQLPGGKVSCMFKTPNGTATAATPKNLVNDNTWHTVRCTKTSSSVTLVVDGTTYRANKPTGVLNNAKSWSLGGKPECNATTVTCDYFGGQVDYLRFIKG